MLVTVSDSDIATAHISVTLYVLYVQYFSCEILFIHHHQMMHIVSFVVSTLLIICTLMQLGSSVSILNDTDFHLHIRNSYDGSPSISSTADGSHSWQHSDGRNRNSAVFEVTIKNYRFHDNYRVTISDYMGGIVCDLQTNYTIERYNAVNFYDPYSPSSSYSISASCVSEDTVVMALQPYSDNVFYLTVFSVETEELLCNSTHLFFYTPASTVTISAEVRGIHRIAVATGTLVTAVFLWRRYIGKYSCTKVNNRVVESNHSQSDAKDGKGDHGSSSSWESWSQPSSSSLLRGFPLTNRYVSNEMKLTIPGNESYKTAEVMVGKKAIGPLPLYLHSTPIGKRRRAVFVDELDILRAYYGQLPASSTYSKRRGDDAPRMVRNRMSDFDFYVIRSYFEQSSSSNDTAVGCSSSGSSHTSRNNDNDRPIIFRRRTVRMKNSKQTVG